jgi:CRISPR-associated DxTHG motif protein
MATWFLTAIGLGKYVEATYELEGRRWRSQFAPVATARLAGLRDATALVLVTPRVGNTPSFGALEKELSAAGLSVEQVDISERIDAAGLRSLVRMIDDRIPDGAALTLDVTHGYRHLPFIYHAILVFLTGLKNARLDGMYYGARELVKSPDPVPLLDLAPTMALMHWFAAAQALRDYGETRGIGRLLRSESPNSSKLAPVAEPSPR